MYSRMQIDYVHILESNRSLVMEVLAESQGFKCVKEETQKSKGKETKVHDPRVLLNIKILLLEDDLRKKRQENGLLMFQIESMRRIMYRFMQPSTMTLEEVLSKTEEEYTLKSEVIDKREIIRHQDKKHHDLVSYTYELKLNAAEMEKLLEDTKV
ncbi:hypothetical protein LXL04_012117 [Taraxacum kok-saghyz]